MNRLIVRPNLADKAVRQMLPDRKRPYYALELYGRHLGYLKRGGEGFWVARFRVAGGSYRQHRLGLADDSGEADGETILTHQQASASARLWFTTSPDRDLAPEEQKRLVNQDLHFCPVGDVFTIGHALHDYVEWKRLSARSTNFGVIMSLINFHIVPRLVQIPVSDFAVEHVQRFMREVMQTPPKRGNRPLAERVAIDDLDDDALRKRKKTVNTLLSILRVALRMAWENGKVESERAWLRLRRFTNVDEPTRSPLEPK